MDNPRIGLEIEGAVVRAETFEVTDAGDLFQSLRLSPLEGRVCRELNAETIELAVAPAPNARALKRNVDACIEALNAALDASGRMACFAGLLPSKRYSFNLMPAVVRLDELYGRAVYDAFSGCHGLHLHRDCGTGDLPIAVYNAIRVMVPAMIALTANSPLTVAGRYRGMCSERLIARRQAPLSGPAPRASQASLEEYRIWMNNKIRLGVFEGASATHYDVRPLRFDLGTVEVIALDACEDPEMWLAAADLYDCFCESIAAHLHAGTLLPAWLSDVDDETLAYNRHRAVRDGTRAVFVESSNRKRVPMEAYMRRLLDLLEESGSPVGSGSRERIQATLSDGCPAEIKIRAIERLTGRTGSALAGSQIDDRIIKRVFLGAD